MHHARRLFERAAAEQWAIGAFNAANIETIRAIFQAAHKLEAPVIIETSPGETEYFGRKALRSVIDAYQEEFAVAALLNLDHATEEPAIELGIDAGYDLIHFDGGQLDYPENIRRTSAIVRQAHRHHLLVEGEIDHITGSSNDHRNKQPTLTQQEGVYTDPERARDFVQATGIDTLAVFIGNVHGLYKTPPTLDLERLASIHENVDVLLALHGGSGIRDEDIRQAVAHGVTKINVNSELRLAYRDSLAKTLKTTNELAAYKYMEPVVAAVQVVVEAKIKLFGSAGKAKRTWTRRLLE